MRGGKEGIYAQDPTGQGSEELLYVNPGAFMDLSDWSLDGRFLAFSISDIKGGDLYILKLEGGPGRKPIEIFHSDLRIFDSHFSPDGRYLSYFLLDKKDKGEIFVRSTDPAAKDGPWQISDGSFSPGFWVEVAKSCTIWPATGQ